jgi:hypothetical protein
MHLSKVFLMIFENELIELKDTPCNTSAAC